MDTCKEITDATDAMDNSHRPTITIHRPSYNYQQIEEEFGEQKGGDISLALKVKYTCKNHCNVSQSCVKSKLRQKFPFFDIMRQYKLKEWLLQDFIAGLSIAVIHIPQGMGFALLTGVPPVYGLYSSLFPSFFYFFFGTSRHNSLGTMAVVSLMIGSVVLREFELSGIDARSSNSTFEEGIVMSNETSSIISEEEESFKVGIATSVTLLMGLWQVLFSIFNLGTIATFMPMTFIGGFMTGSAFHIATSQVPLMLGISLKPQGGNFQVPVKWYSIFASIHESNVAEVIITCLSATFLIAVKEAINEKFKNKLKVPVPAELILVVIATLASHFADLHGRFGIRIVGAIPRGLPVPKVPPMDNATNLLLDAVILALVSFAVTISMAKMFSKKHGYPIDQNQEMFASGVSFGLSSLFHCFGGAQAPPRTLVQESTGGKTQLAGLVSCSIVLLVCVIMGPLFQSLPIAALASIITVAIIPLFMQFRDLKRYFILNKYDFLIWIVTWLSTTIIGVVMGIIIGVSFSLLTVVFQAYFTSATSLERRIDDLFIESTTGESIETCNKGVKVVKFPAPLFFANVDRFKSGLSGILDTSSNTKECGIRYANGAASQENGLKDELSNMNNNSVQMNRISGNCNAIQYLVLDCSAINYIDIQGLNCLVHVRTDLRKHNVKLLLCNCSRSMYEKLVSSGYVNCENKCDVFVSIYDAILQLS